ncbi:phosphotransferase [Psychromicrobium xiongbiense]|uniref:phosphotransferase n=1 Tax=Psychromicrobium xiongbiense TaxID=3051184 RepID=UPI0025545218|nr:phosphotransferase [Psychromicrobium sp. YIM S02556]
MHEGQLTLSEQQVATLVMRQFPHWASLSVRALPSSGTVSSLFRLGEELLLRFPLESADPEAKRVELEAEVAAARRLLDLSRPRAGAGLHKPTVQTPEPLALGEPGEGYPLPWSVYRWIPGRVAVNSEAADSVACAIGLAEFVAQLRSLDTEGRSFAGSGRGGVLQGQDQVVAHYSALGWSLPRREQMIDVARLLELWGILRQARRPASASDAWTHGDLMPGNLLLDPEGSGRLAAVIDICTLAVADPAVDLMPAWNLFGATARTAYREALAVNGQEVSDDEWERGQAWAFAQAVGCLWYYRRSNPLMSEIAERTLLELLTEKRL